MNLTSEEQAMLAGEDGRATQKAMQILVALGKIYGAERMVPVSSVQVAGVSYDNLGEAGLQFLDEMASGGGRARVLATLNPAGMDAENRQALAFHPESAAKRRVSSLSRMGVINTTCSGQCTTLGACWAEAAPFATATGVGRPHQS
jgi:predicted aconitase